MMQSPDVLLQMTGVSKAFAGTAALRDATLTVRRGEIHALMGQNGAGKSTLIKILTGVYAPDSGAIEFEGVPVAFRSPNDAQRGGISPIYQEINLVGQRTVAENVFLAKEARRFGLVDRRAMSQRTREILARVGVAVDPDVPLNHLSTATQQMVAIARALSFDAKLIIMDEPTSSLHDREVDTLFDAIRQLKASGVAVIFISHKLDELYRICDHITILRDGRTVATSPLADLSRLELVSTMLGRNPESIEAGGQTAFSRDESRTGQVLLQTHNLASGMALRRASLTVRTGEILGLAGLLGSGRSELAGAIAGSEPVDGGTIELDGRPYTPSTPRAGIDNGIVMTPEDRKTDGLVGIMSVAENISLSILKRISRFGFVNKKRESDLVQKYMTQLQIKASSSAQKVGELSGGNQQKVLLARSIAAQPRLLILDEPTRGVDVGAKREIQKLISDTASDERGVILVSSEMEEIVEGSDRIHVLRDGESVAYLDARTVSNSQIMIYMASGDVDGRTERADQ